MRIDGYKKPLILGSRLLLIQQRIYFIRNISPNLVFKSYSKKSITRCIWISSHSFFSTMKYKSLLLGLALGQALGLSALADDWPQWLGAKRDGVWRESGILKEFPDGGPKVNWRVPIGGGYAGPAVAKVKVYVTDRQLAKDATNPDIPFSR